MIIKEINVDERKLNYFIGINQIQLNFKDYLELKNISSDKDALDIIFNLIIKIQEKFTDSILQFIDDSLILNEHHIFSALYFVQKAFQDKINILNKKNMELLLYLTTKRQIKKGIESFGMKITSLKEGFLTYVVVSAKNNIIEINQEILQLLGAKDGELTITKPSIERFNRIKQHFQISNEQINSIRNSYGFNQKDNVEDDLESLFLAVHDLLCEKMSILSLEKVKID